MPLEIDHLVLPVADAARSIAFYTRFLGLTHEGEDGQFAVLRVAPSFVLLLAPWPPAGQTHLAFATSKPEFDAAFERLRDGGIPYGGSFDTVGTGSEPGDETGARGTGKSLYCFDPDRHLVELRYYEA